MIKISISLLIGFSLLIITSVNAQDIDIAKKAIIYLADGKLEGRFPGTKGDKKSIKFLKKELKSFGVKPFEFGYVQTLSLVTDIKHGKESYAKINDSKLKLGKDYLPFNFSAEKGLNNKAVVYSSINDTEQKYNGEWVLLFSDHYSIPDYKSLIKIVIETQHNGAGGFVLITEVDDFHPFVHNRSVSPIGIPALQISKECFEEKCKLDISQLSSDDNIPFYLDAFIDIDRINSETANVAGFIEKEGSEEWIVIGAHYDHLGWGGPNSGSRAPEKKAIHYGADDNASGTAMVLMLAEYFADNPVECNLAFVLFGAEEQGLIGSKYFVNNLPINKDEIKLMLNYDMVGRMIDNKLTLIGSTTAIEFDSLINTLPPHNLDLSLKGGGYSGSDQASFYSEQIPVIFFYSGTHSDYHTPSDIVELINFEGMELTASLSLDLINLFAKPETSLTYQELEQQSNSRHGGEMKVKLGIMPDITDDSGKGLRLDGIVPGGTAHKAKMQKGDIITELNGTKISGIYDYMQIMSELKEGQEVKAKIIRNEKEIEIDLKF
jgi:aminopeptidase YwaD